MSAGLSGENVAEQLTEMWEELLDLDEVVATDTLLAAGGNSLTAVMLANRVELAWGCRPTMEMLLSDTFQEIVEWCSKQIAEH
jgi:hypothetical protein